MPRWIRDCPTREGDIVVTAAGRRYAIGRVTANNTTFGVWTGDWDNTISKVDPHTNRVVAIYKLPDAPQNVNYADGSLWVDSYDASKVWRIQGSSPEYSIWSRARTSTFSAIPVRWRGAWRAR